MIDLPVSLFVVLAVTAAMLAAVLWQRREVATIYPPAIGLLYRDGRFERELQPGRYAWFDFGRRRKVVRVSTATLPLVLPEVTVLSKDQFSFRLALAPVVAINDARGFAESQPLIEAALPFLPATLGHAALHPLLAAAALEEVGTRTLAEVMAHPQVLLTALRARLADALPGAEVTDVMLTAINLPPETRKMFTDVERARMEAQALLERARGEQAALRVLANAARLMSDNPALANLRLLQAIEASKGQTTIVLGDGAMQAHRSP